MQMRYPNSTMNHFRRLLPALALVFSLCHYTFATGPAWSTVGPDGGDARSFASERGNARHLFLGTTSSWIYESNDGGSSWKRIVNLDKTQNLIIDSLLVNESNPKMLLAGAWSIDNKGGGIWMSQDSGHTWNAIKDMQGQAIYALAQAASDSREFVAGTLKGVFRSQDGGAHWSQISEAGSSEIHEVESIAIDPNDPNTIFAGTWHLPWKTTDGGKNWHNIKQGVIDDSDVFSIIIDPQSPTTVYASACSGIYKSDNYGELFHKAQGIPNTARRTRVLMQDPTNHQVVYAGTTEGLYRTQSAGTDWQRLTSPDVIVNDVFVDPTNPKHVLLATDRSGVLASEDEGANFQASNTGFTQRQVATLLVDAKDPRTFYAGVVNDKRYGGVFVSTDAGTTWTQRSDGLDGRDVFTLAQAQDGTVLAGTSRGIFRWNGSAWTADGNIIAITQPVEKKTATRSRSRSSRKAAARKTARHPAEPKRQAAGAIEDRVNYIDASGGTWYAATAKGLYVSKDQGQSWEGPAFGATNASLVHSTGDVALAVGGSGMQLSSDNGDHWQSVSMPAHLSSVQVLSSTPGGELWAGGREGLFSSSDKGQNWTRLDALPFNDLNGLTYDPQLKRLLVTSARSTLVLALDPDARTWKWWDTGWNIHDVRSSEGHLLAASRFEGVVIQPGAVQASAELSVRQPAAESK
jgi:photosystem II stability/assembly factor-like uncharacterized protein